MHIGLRLALPLLGRRDKVNMRGKFKKNGERATDMFYQQATKGNISQNLTYF